MVTLREELGFVRDYADLMQIRHGESLKIIISTDGCYDDYLIVPLAIEILVENAIKHNATSQLSPLIISIKTDDNGLLTVSNNYQPREYPEDGEGVGLANLAERYRLKWQKDISIENHNDCFQVTFPLIPNP